VRSFVEEVMSSNLPPIRRRKTTTTTTRRAELAHRTSDGIDVYLFWNQPGNHVTISVSDNRNGDRFELEVDNRHAIDAFNHPYAYAASGCTDRLSAPTDALAS
jgi:hypothetical protein